ncbi:metallophosphoesterase [Pedobacter nyackensis]|uniref:Calcineurin-like phosphoesterase n=1 Tax=Pedobacter nyackensis TaxID=475255 RepID=A0A1W2EHD4_9SPHI|nr:metallophosphoesterase [Pedobacter nyackensis]SMD08568.1 Calcineurin-like phosphoesterase [Pedobacter nyackensis]
MKTKTELRMVRTNCHSFILCFLLFINGIAKGQQAQPIIRFGVIADIQYAEKEDHGSRFYRNSIEKMDSCIIGLNKKKLAFNVVFGDLVDQGPKDLKPIMAHLRKLRAGYKNVLGNHDYVDVKDKEMLYKQFDMPAPHYVFEKANWMFIVLNTNEVSEYGANENSPFLKEWRDLSATLKREGRKNSLPWNGGISSIQLNWLENNLKRAQNKQKNVLVFTHHPLYPENGYEALNNREILRVLEMYPNVKGVISGHHHEGNFAYYNKIPSIVLEGMVETSKENAYGVVELYPNKIVLIGHGRMTSRTLDF